MRVLGFYASVLHVSVNGAKEDGFLPDYIVVRCGFESAPKALNFYVSEAFLWVCNLCGRTRLHRAYYVLSLKTSLSIHSYSHCQVDRAQECARVGLHNHR